MTLFTSEALTEIGLRDLDKARRLLVGLAGQGVSDDDLAPLLPLLLGALLEAADADRALAAFARWFTGSGSPRAHLQTLLTHPLALDLFAVVTGSSQYFADVLARQPETFEIIANPASRDNDKSLSALRSECETLLAACRSPELKRDALRRWKAREMLRIGVRDLAEIADMPATARAFSHLADVCVGAALSLARDVHAADTPVAFAVVAMGKLGGQELNYASDIDLIFVHGDGVAGEIRLQSGRVLDAPTYLSRLAETLIKTLTDETANGYVFRVDMRLRPEGRFGTITRSLAGFRAYYENWAESWERQSLIKARFVAGDADLGAAFHALIAPYVYRRHVALEFLNDIRANKRLIEQHCAAEGETYTNVKTGWGGIRDVEFLVQLKQLEFGGVDARLQTTNTLTALRRLDEADLLTPRQAGELADDYRFLRTLEHRLQLLHGFQTQVLPSPDDRQERELLARRMNFDDAEVFEAELEMRRARVRGWLDQLFYREEAKRAGEQTAPPTTSDPDAELQTLLDLSDTPGGKARLGVWLHERGFDDLPAALRALGLPMRGNEFGGMPPDTPTQFRRVAPRLLALAADSAAPDAALAGLESLALAVPNRAQLYAGLADSPDALPRLIALAAGAPPLFQALTRHQEWLETVFSEEEEPEEEEDRLPSYADDLFRRLERGREFDAQMGVIARFQQREMLTIGARSVWRVDSPAQTSARLTALADALLTALLACCRADVRAGLTAQSGLKLEAETVNAVLGRVAIVGLGKLGGQELGFASDWDAVLVYAPLRGPQAPPDAQQFPLVDALAHRLVSAVEMVQKRGANIELDLRLRPYGREGALIYTLRGFVRYFRDAGATWERQAALKARWVGGNERVGLRFVRILHALSFGWGLADEATAEIRAMKQRIETERLNPKYRDLDVKLGYGGLTDIEWLAQILQLRWGQSRITLRRPGTRDALNALAHAQILPHDEVAMLTETYDFLTNVRNAMWLLTGMAHDVLLTDPARQHILARVLGFENSAGETAETGLLTVLRQSMSAVRNVFEARFYAPRPAG